VGDFCGDTHSSTSPAVRKVNGRWKDGENRVKMGRGLKNGKNNAVIKGDAFNTKANPAKILLAGGCWVKTTRGAHSRGDKTGDDIRALKTGKGRRKRRKGGKNESRGGERILSSYRSRHAERLDERDRLRCLVGSLPRKKEGLVWR